MTNEEILKEIAVLEEKLENAHGSKCEVWSRVCGFFRPTSAYNPGKQEEFKERVNFEVQK